MWGHSPDSHTIGPNKVGTTWLQWTPAEYNHLNNWILSETVTVGSCLHWLGWAGMGWLWYPGWCQHAVKVGRHHRKMSRLAGNVPAADHTTTPPHYHRKRPPTPPTSQIMKVGVGPALTLVHLTGCSSVEIMSSIMVQQGDRLFSLRW